MTNTLGSQLKRLRLARGLSREQVALRSGVKADHIRYIEHDYVDFPRRSTLQKLTSALGCKVTVSVVVVDVSESEER